jgi:leucyl aminopeptidase (aminopeptidase T)
MEENRKRGAEILVGTCAGLRRGEKAYVLCDSATEPVADYVFEQCRRKTEMVRRDVLAPLRMHGERPPERVGESMAWADVVFCLTSVSLAHTEERKKATDGGTRFLSLPDYSLDLLAGESLLFDFRGVVPLARALAQTLDRGSEVRVTSDSGTDVRFLIAERKANVCPGVCLNPGDLGSPPDAEVNIAPREDSAEGAIVVDGSVPCREIGALRGDSLTLQVAGGGVFRIDGEGENPSVLEGIFKQAGSAAARTLGEFGVGLNPKARLTGRMLEDEGCAGTVHFGFGSNATIGGRNRVAFHLDFVIMRPSVSVDGARIMTSGRPEWGDGPPPRSWAAHS